jgi:hypothetical protein
MNVDRPNASSPASKAPEGAPKAEPAQTKSGVAKALNNNVLGVQQFDMTEEEVRIWDTKVGIVVGLLLFVGAGSALVFGVISLINWMNR